MCGPLHTGRAAGLVILSLLQLLPHVCGDILYGSILDRFVRVENNDPDIITVAEYALSYLRHESDNPEHAYAPRVLHASKHVLQHTKDSETPFIVVMQDHFGRLHRRPVILGITYYIDLEWDLPAHSHHPLTTAMGPAFASTLTSSEGVRHIHRFAITKDRTGALSVLRHTVLVLEHGQDDPTKPVQLANASHVLFSDQAGWTLDGAEEKSGVQVDASLRHEHGPRSRIAALAPAYLPHKDTRVLSCPAAMHPSLPAFLRAPSGWHAYAHAGEGATLRMLSLNIWNLNGHDQGVYESRVQLLGAVLASARADIIALQEVRHDAKRDSQPLTLARHLPGYQYVFQPAMSYPERVFTRVEEGVAVFSRFPIVSHAFILLSRDEYDDTDVHQRICLRVTVATPAGHVQVFVTHLSLNEEARDRSAVEIWRFMQSTPSVPQILVGDLNALPPTRAMRFLAGQEVIEGERTDLVDAWLAHHPEPRGFDEYMSDDEPRDYGLTFSTLDEHLGKRIDYAFVRGMRCTAIETYPERSPSVEGIHFSDHLGLLMELSLSAP